MKRSGLAGLVLLLACAWASGDTLKLRNGGVVQGEILSESDAEYVVATKLGKIKVSKADVVAVEKGKLDETPQLKSRLRALLSLTKQGRFVAARKDWDALHQIPSPVWTDAAKQAEILTELGWEPPQGSPTNFETLTTYLDGVTHGLCFTCEATGSLPCPECGGRGKLPCPECKGNPRICPACKGKGALKCEDCDGKGRVRCPTCLESKRPGYLVTEEMKDVVDHYDYYGRAVTVQRKVVTQTPCATCKGESYVPCKTCMDSSRGSKFKGEGKVPCEACQGTGRLPCEAKCDNGYSPKPCPKCEGTGRMACPDCGGTGKDPKVGGK